MMDLFKRMLPTVFMVILICNTGIAIAQTGKDTLAQEIKEAGDTLNLPLQIDSAQISTVKEQLKQNYKDSVTVESDVLVAVLVKKIESTRELINTAARISEKGFDTAYILKNLPSTERLLNIIESNFVSRNAFQNLRALKTTKNLLLQSEIQFESWQNILFGYIEELADLKLKLAEARRDSVLRNLPKDSLLKDIYFGQIAGLLIRWKMADSAISTNMLQMGILQNRVATDFLRTKDFLSKTNDRLKKYIQELWIPEEPSLFKAKRNDYDVSFSEAYTSSADTIGNLIAYSFERNTNLWIPTIVLILLLYLWLKQTFQKLKKQNIFSDELKASSRLVSKYPLLTATGVVLTFICIFFFNLPPSINSLTWTLLAIIFFILSRLTAETKKIFPAEALIIFLVFNNLSGLLKNSLGERWIQFILDLLTTGYGIFMIKNLFNKKDIYPTYTIRILFVFTIFSAGALITNSYGSFMLAKALNNGAAYAIITANVLYITSDIIVRIIYLQQEAFKRNKFVSYFTLNNLQQTIGKLLGIAAIIAWVVIMMQQLNLFDYAYDGILEFLTAKRTLGSHSFAFGSLFIFIGVIWFSSILSKIIMIFFGGGDSNTGAKKNWWGSMLILVKLGILTTGIFIAFIAAGIPLDKLTIIIGALGVGIGFGMQNIVNNLVSGVILAFERPVQVGDAIEVGNRYGTIKEIGIRSTKMVTVEGSEVIVPNGDMLSEHIINWTLSSHYRRVEIIVGVSYNTDLRVAQKILKEIVSAQKDVEINPSPSILAHNFSESSIDFRILFWCHIDTWVSVKSEVLMNVHQAFNKYGIEIPFPQRDINIKGAENLLHNEEKKEKE